MKKNQYVEAIGRNPGEEKNHSHLYRLHNGEYEPMCGYAWNRSNGTAFSIFRGHSGAKGLCKTCDKRRKQNLPGVEPWPHKTQWSI